MKTDEFRMSARKSNGSQLLQRMNLQKRQRTSSGFKYHRLSCSSAYSNPMLLTNRKSHLLLLAKQQHPKQSDTFETYLSYLESHVHHMPDSCVLECFCWFALHYLAHNKRRSQINSDSSLEKRKDTLESCLLKLLLGRFYFNSANSSHHLADNETDFHRTPGSPILPSKRRSQQASESLITAEELCKLMWCLTALQLQKKYSDVIKCCWIEFLSRINEFNHRELVCCFYCAASTKLLPAKELNFAFSKAIQKLYLCDFAEAAALLLAFENIREENADISEKIHGILQNRRSEASPTSLAAVISLLAGMLQRGKGEQRLLEKLVEECVYGIGDWFDGEILTAIALSINECRMKAPTFYGILARHLKSHLNILSSEQCCSLAYAFALQQTLSSDGDAEQPFVPLASISSLWLLPSLLPYFEPMFESSYIDTEMFSIYKRRRSIPSWSTTPALTALYGVTHNLKSDVFNFFKQHTFPDMIEVCLRHHASLSAEDLMLLQEASRILYKELQGMIDIHNIERGDPISIAKLLEIVRKQAPPSQDSNADPALNGATDLSENSIYPSNTINAELQRKPNASISLRDVLYANLSVENSNKRARRHEETTGLALHAKYSAGLRCTVRQNQMQWAECLPETPLHVAKEDYTNDPASNRTANRHQYQKGNDVDSKSHFDRFFFLLAIVSLVIAFVLLFFRVPSFVK